MRIPRLYVDLPLATHKQFELPLARAHYLVNVLRIRQGQAITLFNGQGGEYNAVISQLSKKRVLVEVGTFNNINNESHLHIELAIGLSKGDRMDWVMQKATELGVKTFIPILTERSEVKLSAERWQKKLNHWQEIIINACEQCGRNITPALREPIALQEYVKNTSCNLKLILHPYDNSFALAELSRSTSISLLVGPEGGFSSDEVHVAISAEFGSWQLGPRILRTETAPLAAISVLQARYGDFS